MQSHLKTARLLTDLLDNHFKLGKFSFGLDPFFDLIPILGGLVPAGLSFYIVWIAMMMKLPPDKISQMIGNIVFDYLLGVIPIIGTAADFVFKANVKNMKILEDWAKNPEVYDGQLV